MNTRKKTPKAISEQLKRIVRYLMIRRKLERRAAEQQRTRQGS